MTAADLALAKLIAEDATNVLQGHLDAIQARGVVVGGEGQVLSTLRVPRDAAGKSFGIAVRTVVAYVIDPMTEEELQDIDDENARIDLDQQVARFFTGNAPTSKRIN